MIAKNFASRTSQDDPKCHMNCLAINPETFPNFPGSLPETNTLLQGILWRLFTKATKGLWGWW